MQLIEVEINRLIQDSRNINIVVQTTTKSHSILFNAENTETLFSAAVIRRPFFDILDQRFGFRD